MEVETEEIYRDEEFNLKRASGFSQEVIEFLDTTTWGTEDTLYEHKKTDERISDLTDPIPVLASVEDRLLALVVMDRRRVRSGNFSCISYFFRYLASNASFRERAIVGKAGQKTMDIVRESEQDKAIYFASIEGKNRRSYNFVKGVGYEQIGQVHTVGFSRFFPRKSRFMRPVLTERDRERVLHILQEHYSSHSLVHFSNLFKNGGCYVLEKEGVIKAIVQAYPALWVIKQMKGKMGKILMKYVPHIPILNKMFNPRKFEFLAFEGLYFRDTTDDLVRLMESVLAEYGLKSAMFWLDDRDTMYATLTHSGKLGLLHRFVKDSSAYILASFRNLTQEEEKEITNAPVYMSGFDCI